MTVAKKTTPKQRGLSGKRRQVYRKIEEMFGVVPSMFKALPDSSLSMEWQLFKRVQFDEGPIPNRYRELIGVAISAVTKCKYCSFFHTEAAKLNGLRMPKSRTPYTLQNQAPAGVLTLTGCNSTMHSSKKK
jgi:AhpD family alkylhydroperoxidase